MQVLNLQHKPHLMPVSGEMQSGASEIVIPSGLTVSRPGISILSFHLQKTELHAQKTAANKNTTQVNPRRCICYCLTAPCELGSVSNHASASPSRESGSLATVSGQRRPVVSTRPLGSKHSTNWCVLTVDAFSLSHNAVCGSTPMDI